MKLNPFLLGFTLMVIVISCKKVEPDTTKPIIANISPVPNGLLKAMPDSALIKINFTDNAKLLHYNLRIVDSLKKFNFDTALYTSQPISNFQKHIKIPYFGTKSTFYIHIKVYDEAQNSSELNYSFFVDR